jgi:enoyl-[acyl-carrier-protein] reductase (NADH)
MAMLAMFLLSNMSRMITGQTFLIDAGQGGRGASSTPAGSGAAKN